MVKKLPKGEKKFFFFLIIYFTISLSPSGKKENHLLFPPFLSPEIEKPQGKTSHKKFFFFFFFYIFVSYRSSYSEKLPFTFFFPNSDFKCPKLPLSALKFDFLQIKRPHTPTHRHSVFPTHNAYKGA